MYWRRQCASLPASLVQMIKICYKLNIYSRNLASTSSSMNLRTKIIYNILMLPILIKSCFKSLSIIYWLLVLVLLSCTNSVNFGPLTRKITAVEIANFWAMWKKSVYSSECLRKYCRAYGTDLYQILRVGKTVSEVSILLYLPFVLWSVKGRTLPWHSAHGVTAATVRASVYVAHCTIGSGQHFGVM